MHTRCTQCVAACVLLYDTSLNVSHYAFTLCTVESLFWILQPIEHVHSEQNLPNVLEI